MQINADLSKRAVVHSELIDWVETRMKGVRRRMLDRNGAEQGRATSIVSYEPDSKFASHVHTGGEEFIVLDGVFQDEHGDYPVGSYVRNPPGTSHTPGSDEGCVIFVKLWQFDDDDKDDVRIRFDKMAAIAPSGRPGVAVAPLFNADDENVRIEHWEANTNVHLDDEGGIEVLVIAGSFEENNEVFDKHSWLRVPEGDQINAVAGKDGAQVWIKSGHLKAENIEAS